ncbi:pyridoxamine 5'-phosphate oxidase family protein [Angustibacter sp. McL0619]|uniref:pyridoxamine 5'-phosphate oxidase family protein n=1 Tax=Angustibacter sp. McL0619 TaxID=3415676 RepID=UPI003CF41C79
MATMDLAQRARLVMDSNQYLTLGTSEDDGRPRVSPVYFTHSEYREVYWVSSPDSAHSHNIAARPDVSVVIFDSTAEVGQGSAVYLTGTAEQVLDDELEAACSLAFAKMSGAAKPFAPAELSGDAELRLYRLKVTRHEVHVRGSDPDHGNGIDRRVEVSL